MTLHTPIATAADYADALLSARRAKNFLFWLLLLMLLIQLAVFILAKYTDYVLPPEVTDATTRPSGRTLLSLVLQYLTGLIDFLGIALAIVFSLTLLLMLNILIMGRLLGVAQMTTAYIASIFFVVLLFPWQAFLNFSDLGAAQFRLPGVLYSWPELVREAHFDRELSGAAALLKWGRYVGFPLAAIFLLVSIQSRSRRSLRRALGEVTIPAVNPPAPEPSQRPAI
jgi:hypothetical protein